METATRRIPVYARASWSLDDQGAMDVSGHLMQKGNNDAAKMAILTLVLMDVIPGVRPSGARKRVQSLYVR